MLDGVFLRRRKPSETFQHKLGLLLAHPVWGMPVLHPERTAGVVGVCTPYTAMPPTDTMRLAVGGDDERLYILLEEKAY